MITPADRDVLDAYLADRLAQHERDALEQRLKESPALADELLRLAREETIIRDWAEAETQAEAERLVMARAGEGDTSTVEEQGSRRGIYSRRAANGAKRRPLSIVAALAAALLLVVGLFVVLINNHHSTRIAEQLTGQEKRRHQVIVDELRELNLERQAIETAKKRRRPRPKPVAPTPEETARLMAQLELKEAEAVKDAEEVARMIDTRRRFVMEQLRSFGERAKLPDDLDVEDFDPGDPTTNGPLEVAETEPIEVGRVLVAEGDRSGVLIREADEGAVRRLPLAKDLALLSGDRIETAQGTDVPCASVRLKGGATIDIDRGSSVKVLGRGSVHFHTGRIYAHINVPLPDDTYPNAESPFSLQADAGRLLAHDTRVELHLSPASGLQARIDGGKAHLVNRRGHTVGRKGQELWAQKGAQPRQRGFFSKPIWRGRNCTNPGLPIGKSNPVLLSSGFGSFNMAYALALAHTGEIDLRGVLIVRGTGDHAPSLANRWRVARDEVTRLRTTGLRFTTEPVMGTPRRLQAPASGRYQDVIPERSPAVNRLLMEAGKASPDLPLVVVTSGSLTDLASAWLIDQRVAERVVAVTDAGSDMRNADPWAFRIVLEEYRCVSVRMHVPARTFPVAGLKGTRWGFISKHAQMSNRDFSRFGCVTVAGFVREAERVRFIAGPDKDTAHFRFQPDPNGRTWMVRRADNKRLIQEFKSTFVTGPTAK